MIVFPILAMEHHTNAGYSEHLEKKLTEKAESQIIMSPEEEGVAEGSVKHQDSPKPGENNQITSKAVLLASVLGQRLVNSLQSTVWARCWKNIQLILTFQLKDCVTTQVEAKILLGIIFRNT